MPKYKRAALSKATRFDVFKRDSFKCQYCGRSAPEIVLECDHIHPVAAGGDSEITNLITACVDCNRGKGARKLSDQSAVLKQKAQLDELQERREQLEMLMEWKTGLQSIDADAVDQLAEMWRKSFSGFSLSETGKTSLRKLVRAHGAPAVADAVEKSRTQYAKFDTDGKLTTESVNRAFSKLGGICKVEEAISEKEYLKDLFYIRAILRNRFQLDARDQRQAGDWLEAGFLWGVTAPELTNMARESTSITKFVMNLHEAIGERNPDYVEPDSVFNLKPPSSKGEARHAGNRP